MKRLALWLAAGVLALQVTVVPDPLVDGNYRIYGGKRQEYKGDLVKDPLIPGQYRIYTNNGKWEGDARIAPLPSAPKAPSGVTIRPNPSRTK